VADRERPADEFLARRRAFHAGREPDAPATVVAIGDYTDPLARIAAECMTRVAAADTAEPANLRCTGCERHWYADNAQAFAGSPCLHESTLEDHCSGRIQIL